ncbi:MAG TPA: secondary thiamine-phosphate synthase enzyme YjbQ [Armatimonadota bacterium]
MRKISVRTAAREQMVDITRQVQQAVQDGGGADGVVTVFCPHTTAAVTINENADPDVQRDVLAYLGRLIPREAGFRHAEGNSDSHIKTVLTGPSVQVIVEGGTLMLGTWQGIYLCEFDGPRNREVWIYT